MEFSQTAGPFVLFLLMMMVGLELRAADFKRVLSAPRAVIGGTIGQWVILPVLTLGVVDAFDLSPSFAVGAILVAVSPGAGMSNIMTAFGRANIALSVSLTATASVFAVITLPVIAAMSMRMYIVDADPIQVPVGELIGQLLLTLLLPIGLGMWLRTRHPEWAQTLAPRIQRATFIAIGVIVVVSIVLFGEEQNQFEGAGMATVAAGVWTLAAGAAGWGLATVLRLSNEDRFTFFIEFSARNIAVATIVAMSGLERLDFTLFSIVYASIGYPIIVAAVIIRRVHLNRVAKAAGSD